MPWFKVDDKLHDHRKQRKAGKSAMGVWVLAGSWSADNRQDGFVPAEVLARWGTRRDAERLVLAGFWETAEKNGEQGWQFRDWADYQPTAEDSRLASEAKGQGGTFGNHKRWHKDRGITNPDCRFCKEM